MDSALTLSDPGGSLQPFEHMFEWLTVIQGCFANIPAEPALSPVRRFPVGLEWIIRASTPRLSPARRRLPAESGHSTPWTAGAGGDSPRWGE